jgi:sulfite reductase subunit B
MDTLEVEKKELYNPVFSTIKSIETLTELEKRFEIALPDNRVLGHDPGQFVEVSIFGFGEAPISVCSSPTKIPTFDLTVRKAGRFTERMHILQPGSSIGIRGPFGQGFTVDLFKGKDILFVCGGIGLAPLKSLIDYTIAKRKDYGRLIILYGTKHPSEILFKKSVELWQNLDDVEFHMTVDRADKDWKGKTGVITTLMPPLTLDAENTIATVVGPPIMYKFVIMALKSKRIPDENIYLSLERRMKCGVGKCGHCQINDSYVCQDGPVYSYPRIKQLPEAI